MSWKCLFGHKWNGNKCERCGKKREAKNEQEKESQISSNPQLVSNQSLPANNNQAKQAFGVLVDQYAHLVSAGENEIKSIETQLFSGGNEALTAIMNYLLFCSTGKQKEGWWYNANNLVRLIRRFSIGNHEILLNQLFQQNSNIAEYHSEIKDVAEQELYAIKEDNEKKDETPQDYRKIGANDAHAVLKQLDNLYDAQKRIDKLNGLRGSIDDWNNNDKAFYYYLYAWPMKQLFPNSKAYLAYYAAQLIYNPDKLCIGWQNFSLPSSEYNLETAKKLHMRYPLPNNIEEMQNYKYE